MDTHRANLCNAAVRLTLAGQDLVGLLNAGEDVEAHELAVSIHGLAGELATELAPATPGVA